MNHLHRLSSPLAVLFALALVPATVRGAPTGPPADGRTTEANITRLTTTLLEFSQFSHHPLDADFAGKFLARYLDALDGGHSLLLQGDLAEFGAYRATLARATREQGDTTAAHVIFARYLQRLNEQVEYINKTLPTAKFDFTGHETYSFDRATAERPASAAAARQLWDQQLRAEYLQEKLAEKRPKDIVTTLTRRHSQQLRMMKALTNDEVLEVYLNALAHVYDPHSDYLGHEQMDSLSIAMNLSLFGIGAALETEDGYTTIRELIPGGPAAKSGLLKPGDRIVAVAQASKEPVDIINMPLSRAVELIRGPKGSTVTLTILPAGETTGAVSKTVRLVRDVIKLEDQEAKAQIVDLPKAGAGPAASMRVGIIDLPSFYADFGGGGSQGGGGHRSATADVAKLLKKLKQEHVRGIILDLRRNGGGSLDEAINLTGLFIRKGPVVQTRGPAGEVEVGADRDPSVLYEGPLLLLISRFSASASEILAGALQDYGRAVVVGDSSTFGKGTVQNVLPLARVMDQKGLGHAYDPGALKVTISKFYRPSGASTQLHGVSSDIVLPSTTDFKDISESALKDPLPWDTIAAAPYERVDKVGGYLARLRKQSASRVAADKTFALLAVDIARTRKSLVSKTVSLNEAERRRELAESKSQKGLWQKESQALDATRPPTYELTLTNASAFGLPAAVTAAGPHRDRPLKPPVGSHTDDEEGFAAGHSPLDNVVLREGERILADYVDLTAEPAPAGAKAAPPGP